MVSKSLAKEIRRFRSLILTLLLAAGLLGGVFLSVSRTRAAPGVPPEALHPPRNAVTATLTTTVSVTYDEPISETTVTSRTFAVHGMQSGLVTATHGVVDGTTIVVTPTRPFHQGELVYAIATTRTRNVTGTAPVSGTQWQFNAGRVISRCAVFVEDTAASNVLTGVRDSSVAWGDYDNDGDLDILLTGQDRSFNPFTAVYENTGGAFTAAYTDTLLDVYDSSAAWGDYDNDGDLDILLTGNDSATPFTLVYENTGSGFTEITGGDLTGVYAGSAAWGDYDNDGDLDFLTTGFDENDDFVANMYQNTGSGFVTDTVASENLTGVYNGSAAWGDYDADGDLDILMMGQRADWSSATTIYRNTGSGFITDTAASQDLPDVSLGSSGVWGDYDNDGDLDILLTGFNLGYRAEVYENTDGRFSLYADNLTGVTNSSVAWGDVDNDGDLNILLTGDNNEGYVADVYENEGDGFTATLAAHYLTGVARSSVAWGDYDGDGDLDILLTGEDFDDNRIAKVYENQDCNVDFALTKTADPDPVVAGTGLTTTLVVTNQGNGPLAVLSDTLPPSLTLRTLDQTDNVESEFNAGTHDNTHWFDPGRWADERLTLSDTLQATGVFTSRIFDAGNVVSWKTLHWTPRRPTGKPLPDDGAAETAYAVGDVNMVGNRVLLHLDDDAAPFADTSGYGNDGTCTTCPITGADGRFNDALAFDGVDAVVTVADAHDPARYALEAWVYPETVTDTSVILRTDALSGTAHLYSHLLGIRDGRFLHLTRAGGAEHAITGTTVISPDTWYHVVGTAESGGEIKLYINGQEEARAAGLGALWTGGDRYVLGSSYAVTGTTAFPGRLDEVAVYSRTLSASEITDHYLRGALQLDFEVRACAQPDCSGATWHSPYSEEHNTGLGLPTVTFTPTLPDARYAQYRVTLTTDDPAYAPELRRVALGPDHYDVTAEPPSQCVATSGAFTCTLDALPAGSVATVTARTRVHHAALGPITNTATVTATGELTPETALADNVVTATTQVTSEVEIQIRKYDDDRDLPYWYAETHGMADPVNPGSPLTYTLLVHNSGPSTAWNVTVTDTLPITPTSIVAPDDWSCTTISRILSCTTTALSPWHWDAIVLTGAAPAVSGTITNTAAITAAGSIVRLGSNLSDTITTTVIPLADLTIAKTAAPDPVNPGETLTFTVHVTNTGPYTATGVVVTDTLPADVTNITALDPACSVRAPDVVCALPGVLTPTQSASFQLTVTAPLSGLIENTAVVTSTIRDPVPENNETRRFAAVRPVADLSVAKRDAPDPVDAAAALTYTVVVTNAGPVDAGALTTTVSARTHRNVRVPIGGTAWPYPSSLWLNSVPGQVRGITVTLYGLHHTYPGDLVALLTGPGGRSTVLMANAGGGTDVDDLTLTFHETGESLPVTDTLTATTTYRPTNHGFGESLPAPAPTAPYGSGFAPFYGGSPNGPWRLYVYDTFDSDDGRIADGWGLELVAVTTDTVTLSDTLPAGLTGVTPNLPGWTCTTGADVICTGDRLTRDKPVTLTLAATAPITPGVITNTARVTSTLADLDLTRNTDRITTTVSPVADLSIVKSVTPTVTVPQGAPLTYTLAVSNAGPSPLESTVTVTDALPAVLEAVAITAPGWTCATGAAVEDSRPLTCTLDGLNVGPAPEIVITATAPSTTGLVLRNTAGVTTPASDPITLNNRSAVTVAVGDIAITGLVATNDSPTALGTLTWLHASVATGTNVTYIWAFGDGTGTTGTGAPISYTYPTTGTFTAVVTATNSVSQQSATTTVEIVERYRLYLPLIMRNYVTAPDLIVEEIVATPDHIQVVIRNVGDGPVEDGFWVDAYVDPSPAPTTVNETWKHLSDQGVVWGVTVELVAGEALTLTEESLYYRPAESNITWPLAEGTPIYAQVDSAHADTTYGGVLENHEILGMTYNNITGPTAVAELISYSQVTPTESGTPAPTLTLPPRQR